NRKVSSIEAIVGLGEALVSGQVTPDRYQLRDDALVAKTVVAEQVLADTQAVQLAQLGRRIEAHFGPPQDIEWCLVGGDFQIVQSRPITTLFPIPEITDGENHVYISVGHQQMMTDAMKPLGLSLWQLSAGRPMFVAGGRLFVDVARALASPAMRAALLKMAGQSDPLIGHALQTVLDRGFIPTIPDAPAAAPPAPAPLESDPGIVRELIARNQASVAALERDIQGKTGLELLDFILADIPELKRHLADPLSHRAAMAGMEATWWLNDQLLAWLGEKNAADALALSVDNNVTSEMGLALMAVADVIRPHPEVVAFLHHVHSDNFLDELATLAGGREARDALCAFLDRYGMRCAGEIDITRPRWREEPSTLVPILLGNVKTFEPGAGARRFEHGRHEAARKEREILDRLHALPDGESKADEAKRMIDRLRTFIGYREYPKYGMVCRYFVYKQALMQEAARLVRAGLLREQEDIFWLSFHELHDMVRANHFDDALVRARKEAFRSYRALTAPRVLTSEGEGLSGQYRRDDVPAGALVGLAVSGGTIEGRARVLHDIANADLEPGDILVTRYTDPSWTPLFVAIAGLVTEVGGLMTHGAVIAREYGVPAVVGVEQATRMIRDGQQIRVHGTEGYVEILD
ncbi:MAG TPA: rifamycin-inactivating phosphotransferase, partial [Kofleriaceae bacterium]